MEEKRKFPRYNITTSVSYTDADDGAAGDVTAKNISKGGICLSSIQPMKIGRKVSLAFVMASRTVHAVGRVVWCEEIHSRFFENGIEFISIAEEHLKEIEQYMSKQ
jgi:hypothetical protein